MCQIALLKLLKELDHLQVEVMPQVNLTCDKARARPHDLSNQTNLLAASKNLMDVSFGPNFQFQRTKNHNYFTLQVLKDFLTSVDGLAPTVPDSGIQAALTSAFKSTQSCLTDLRQCCISAESILKDAPLALPQDLTEVVVRRASQANAPLSASLHSIWPEIATRLGKMQTELESNSDHSLPGDTVRLPVLFIGFMLHNNRGLAANKLLFTKSNHSVSSSCVH